MPARPQPRLVSVSLSPAAPSTVPIWYIAHRLGRGRDTAGDDGRRLACTERWLIGRVRQLIELADFPLPVAPRIVAGQLLEGAAAVDKFAMWERAAVDGWFEARRSPMPVLVVDNDEIGDWADELDARAADMARRA